MASKRDSVDPLSSHKPTSDISLFNLSQDVKSILLSPSFETQTKTKPTPLTLLTLPIEIRNRIYTHLLDTEYVNVGLPNVSYTHSLANSILHFRASRPPFPVSTSLFYVNRQLHSESTGYFYSKNLFIRLSLYMSDADLAWPLLSNGLLFSVASPPKVAASTLHALDVSLVMEHSSVMRASVIFPAQYLPRLLVFLSLQNESNASWGPSHALTLSIRNTYAFPTVHLQGDLLEPFRLLHNLSRVEVSATHISPYYAHSLERDMTRPSFSASAWLAGVMEQKEQGNVWFRRGEYEEALQCYAMAVIMLQSTYRSRGEELEAQSSSFNKEVNRLRWQCECNIAFCGVQLGTEWDGSSVEHARTAQRLMTAESAAQNALYLVTANEAQNPWLLTAASVPENQADFYTDAERAKTWFRMGNVHAALKEWIWACGYFERAQELAPKDEAIRKKFAEARDKVDGRVVPGKHYKRARNMAGRAWEMGGVEALSK
ncbi:hypothetical protein K432DRAFT_174564 [Lepidopterella palustris CBS 459.81]|uniref:peptidylprolyl isomerase n=1 Tax=Lepidopterella palustris CBS 459.81 TaxID=1314670 RepID=A0A8E2JAH0_9PEZI|nr:hypothetical protein K432DRAFT_174564 [Lepidopterella palustris CBS 459.81]